MADYVVHKYNFFYRQCFSSFAERKRKVMALSFSASELVAERMDYLKKIHRTEQNI